MEKLTQETLIAIYIAKLSAKNKSIVDGIKIQKIAFIADCFVNSNGKWTDIIADGGAFDIKQNFTYEAWQYGPVNREIYDFVNFNKIDGIINAISDDKISNYFIHNNAFDAFESLVKTLLAKDTWSLVNFTHSFNEYKEQFAKKNGMFDNHEMDFSKILDEFKNKLKS